MISPKWKVDKVYYAKINAKLQTGMLKDLKKELL